MDASPRLLGSGGSRFTAFAGRAPLYRALARYAREDTVRPSGGAPVGRAARLACRRSLRSLLPLAHSEASLRSASRLAARFAHCSRRRRSRIRQRSLAHGSLRSPAELRSTEPSLATLARTPFARSAASLRSAARVAPPGRSSACSAGLASLVQRRLLAAIGRSHGPRRVAPRCSPRVARLTVAVRPRAGCRLRRQPMDVAATPRRSRPLAESRPIRFSERPTEAPRPVSRCV